jgi:phage tail tape measure protein, TP901 family, core region
LELAKAGMTVAQTMDAMPGVLDLAAAGNVDLGYAAKITAGALNAFSLDAKESTRVANLLAAAANASAADIQDLALGFAQGGFAFAAAGQQVDDLAASLALLTNVGLKGTDAGTALKNMFTQLYGPTAKAKDAMKAYNIEIWDAQGNMKPLADIIDIFNRQLGGLSQQQRLAVLDTILLSDGMKAMIPLMTAGKDGFLKMKDAVNEQGAASNVANARMKGLAGAIEYFKGTLDSLMIETALPWLNTLSEIIRKTADWIAKFGELDPALQRNIVVFAALAAALGPVLIYTGLLVSSLGSLIKLFSLLFNPIAMIAFGIGALVIALGGAARRSGRSGNTLRPF